MKIILPLVTIFVALTLASRAQSNAKEEIKLLPDSIAKAELIDLDGHKTSIMDYRGKILLVYLWGTWLGPVRAEIPDLNELQEKFRASGFEVLGINVGDGDGKPESVSKIRSYANKLKINHRLVRSRSNKTLVNDIYTLTKKYLLPQSFIIDRKGFLRGQYIGGGPKVVQLRNEQTAKIVDER